METRYFSLTRRVKLLAVFSAAIMLSACAATAKKTETIEERVNGRWAALFAADIEGAYGYFTPGYRSSVTLQQYQRALETQAVKWTSAEYIDSNCAESTCKVTVRIGYTVYGALPGVKSYSTKSDAEETWILIDGQWYMVPPR